MTMVDVGSAPGPTLGNEYGKTLPLPGSAPGPTLGNVITAIFGGLTAQVDWLGLRVGGHPALNLHSSD